MYANLDWKLLQTLYAVGQSRSLSLAAKKLETTQATISRRIQELELQCGKTLVLRKSSGSSLSPLGLKLFESLKRVDREMESVDTHIRNHKPITPQIIVSCAEMTSVILSKQMKALYKGLGKVDIVITSTNAFLDLVGGEADIAIRNRKPEDASLLFKKLDRGMFNTYSIYGNCADFSKGDRIGKKSFGTYDWVVFSKSKATPKIQWIKKNIPKKAIRYRVHHAALVMDVISNTPGSMAILPRFIGHALPGAIEVYEPIESLMFQHYIVRRNEKNKNAKIIAENIHRIFTS